MRTQPRVIKTTHQDWLPVELPETENTFIKVLEVDETSQTVITLVRFDKNGKAPQHFHHNYAYLYTIEGSWTYDDGTFFAGDMAFEEPGQLHTPSSEEGTIMSLVFRSPNGLFLDNYLEDGTIIHLGMPFFKAAVGISLEEYRNLDLASLVDIIPEKREHLAKL